MDENFQKFMKAMKTQFKKAPEFPSQTKGKPQISE